MTFSGNEVITSGGGSIIYSTNPTGFSSTSAIYTLATDKESMIVLNQEDTDANSITISSQKDSITNNAGGFL